MYVELNQFSTDGNQFNIWKLMTIKCNNNTCLHDTLVVEPSSRKKEIL